MSASPFSVFNSTLLIESAFETQGKGLPDGSYSILKPPIAVKRTNLSR